MNGSIGEGRDGKRGRGRSSREVGRVRCREGVRERGDRGGDVDVG